MKNLISGYGDRLKGLRERANLSQPELEARTGVSQQEISRIETGKIKKINLEALVSLSEFFRVAPGWLLFGVDEVDNLSVESLKIAAAWQSAAKEKQLEIAMKLLQVESPKKDDKPSG